MEIMLLTNYINFVKIIFNDNLLRNITVLALSRDSFQDLSHLSENCIIRYLSNVAASCNAYCSRFYPPFKMSNDRS